jgi:hypothetical protein
MSRAYANGDERTAFSRVARRAIGPRRAGVRANVKTRAARRDRRSARAEVRTWAIAY